ncbi:MFS transporter [Kitasatospora sp. NPDC059408]|uniref:MFS transporter n=1 Tax=Kitasatospora sp. NPDC059408 TaxID=3346823 RepID=UPI0036BBBF99
MSGKAQGRQSLGRAFGWLWAAYGTSAMGTRLAFGAFPFIAVHLLHAGASAVAVLAAAGAAVGAVVAVPLGPWVEFRRKRPVMIGMDLLRCAALLSIPAAHALGWLGFGQLLAVSVAVAAADITFGAASGAYLKSIVPPEGLLAANARFESTMWTTTVLGPPLGGAAVGLLGPVATVAADAVSYLLSALGIRAIGGREARPPRGGSARLRAGDLLQGWRFVLADPELRPLFLNTVLVNALIMATEPVLTVLLLGPLGFAPWQYGLTFAVPCLGGLVGSRLSGPLVARFGRRRVLLVSGTLRACWLPGLVLVGPGGPGMLLVMAVEFGMILCIGVFNPVYSTHRLERVAPDRAARVLTAWSVSAKAATAVLTALWGVLAGVTGPRAALGLAGLCLLATPLLLPRRGRAAEPVPAASAVSGAPGASGAPGTSGTSGTSGV